jgi:exosortase A-associated hydrolase 1
VIECAGEPLVGILHPAGSPADPSLGVLIVVGGPQYRVGSHRQFVQMARELAAAGHTTFRFDYRGMGDSAAPLAGFEHVDADIRAAVDTFLREAPGLSNVVIFGLCDAAAAALLYCLQDPRVRGLILANPWVRTAAGEAKSFVRHYYGQRLLQRSFWRKLFRSELNVTASLLDFSRKLSRASSAGAARRATSFIERMLRGMRSFRGPVLVLISENDLTAQEYRDLCSSSAQWSAAVARDNVLTVDCRGADHTFSTQTAHRQMMSEILRWLPAATPARTALPRSVLGGARP